MKLMRMLAVTALLASSHLVYGQGETPVMAVNVPFAFTAAGTSMPAGRYIISRAQEGQIWRLRTFGHMDIFVTATPREVKKKPATSVLVFDHDAAGYTLRQIQQEAQTDVAEILGPSHAKARKSAPQEVAAVTASAR
jgi:hypothetical protein